MLSTEKINTFIDGVFDLDKGKFSVALQHK